MILQTINKGNITITPDMKVVERDCVRGWPHWGWLLFWIIILTPVALIWLLIGMSRVYYVLDVDSIRCKVTEREFTKLRSARLL